jgi:hypothetical protein
LAIACVTDRFQNSGDYKIYCKSCVLILSAVNDLPFEESDEFKHVVGFFGADFDPEILATQLRTFGVFFRSTGTDNTPTFKDIVDFCRTLDSHHRLFYSEIFRLLKLIIAMPATNATSERSFSCLRRVKTFLRSTMQQKRLNHLMILQAHKERLDQLDISAVANDFVSKSERRLFIFGKT